MAEVALRKQQQINRANRMMFLWVAGVSVVLGISSVASFLFLIPKIAFNEKVLAEKRLTVNTLVHNNETAKALKDNVNALNTNDSLRDTSATPDSKPIQSILDALPSEVNSAALASSLQQKFLSAEGITIDKLLVDPVAGVESVSTNAATDTPATTLSDSNTITFSFSVYVSKDNPEALSSLLRSMEKSIRVIDVTSLKIELQGDRYLMSVQGRGFYEPAKTITLKEKTVKP